MHFRLLDCTLLLASDLRAEGSIARLAIALVALVGLVELIH